MSRFGFLAIQYEKKNGVNFTEAEIYQIKKTKDFIEEKLEELNK